jgi:pimeloyl-ACP methyl ester carboxylesterase
MKAMILGTMLLAAPAFADYANVNGLKLYYEIHGDAGNPPLVLLHGGGSTIGTTFGRVLPLLARTHRVIAFEQQGHGRTTDIEERPFTFEQSADDAAELLKQLRIERADFFGYSNGGSIAMHIAVRHPNMVRRLVVASTVYRRDGLPSGFFEGMARATLADMPAELKDAYVALAPHPDRLQSFHDKNVKRMVEFEDWPDELLRSITMPVLLLMGDRDVVTVEHAVKMYRLFPNAQLAILPGTDHMQVPARAEWQASMIDAFLRRDARE